ncbi:MFS transporter [Paenibacillus sp. YPG26]|uniref:MFS transporter n=1 Tax=Paenibacillus sp. YPG26 TaxID=2878915 RepID=UPI00203BABE5|nr:MFS transporter [Paenibacillus sp. YPG26]USB31775.1 MFS transporter [Paenibacillus sp. YPG26]
MKKLIWIGCLSYFLIGLAHVILGSVLPVVLEHYNRDYSDSGTLIFTQFTGFLLGVLVSPWFNRRFGKRVELLIATGLLCCCELLYMALPPWGWLYIIALGAGFGFGMIEAVIGTVIISAIKENTAIAMSRLEVLFGIGALVMPLIASGLMEAGYWRISFAVVALFGVATIAFWAKGSFGEMDQVLDQRSAPEKTGTQPSKGMRAYSGRRMLILTLFIAFFFLYVGTEMSLANFMPAMLIEKLGMKEAGAALSVTCFWIAMSVGRIFAGYIAEKFEYRVYVLFSCLASAVLLLLLPFTLQVWSSFAVILMLGLAMSGIFSIALVFASKLLPGTEEATPSILIASGGVGGAVLPLLTGWSLDHMAVNETQWMFAGFAGGLLLISGLAFRIQQGNLEKTSNCPERE